VPGVRGGCGSAACSSSTNDCSEPSASTRESRILIGALDDLARRALNAFVHRVVMAFVFFRSPAQMRIFLQHCHRAVLRAAIHDDMFEQWILLPPHTLDGLTDGMDAVETRRDYRDFGRLSHISNLTAPAQIGSR